MELPTLGWARTCMRPKLLRSPMKALPVCEKVRENPQKNHWKLTTAMDIIESQIKANADLRRASPL